MPSPPGRRPGSAVRGERAADRRARGRGRGHAQTLRYYERGGLLTEPDCTLGGHRQYPEQAVTVLRVVTRPHSTSGSLSTR